MLVVENNSVYEIDEECLKRRSVPEECEVYKKIVREREVRLAEAVSVTTSATAEKK